MKICGNLHRCLRASDGSRTRDLNLGKVVLYQLSHTRACEDILTSFNVRILPHRAETGNRTLDLLLTMQLL